MAKPTDIIRTVKLGYVASMVYLRKAYAVLVRVSEGNRPLIRPRCRWEDNTKIGLINR